MAASALKGPFDLTGKVALVTGGNGGMGLGMARGLAKAGAGIVIAARNAQKTAAAVAELKALGAAVEALEVDVADAAACRAMVDTTRAKLGRLDILVNNAGIARGGRPETISLEDWSAVIQTNLTAAMVASQAAYPIMKAQAAAR
jgi:2-deoxy-D-gluconate 3-dehydrogenase